MAVYLQFADRIRNIHRFECQMVTRMLLVLLFILPVLLYLNSADYEGNAVPQGTAADIEAYDFPNSPAPSVVQ